MRNLYIKLLLLIFVSFVASAVYSKDDGPVKGRKKKKSEARNGILKKDFIESYSSDGNLIIKKELDYKSYIESNGGDPIHFTLQTPNKTVNIGEEVEIKITAQLINLQSVGIFENQELRGYTLKVVMPDNFVMTGGDYYDYISGELSPRSNKIQFSIIGFFEGVSESNEFKLIRAKRNTLSSDFFVLKSTLKIKSVNKILNSFSKNFTNVEGENHSILGQYPIDLENLRLKNPCSTNKNSVTFLVDVVKTLDTTVTEKYYLYLCYGGSNGLRMDSVSIMKGRKTVEITHPINPISPAVHVHFSKNKYKLNQEGYYKTNDPSTLDLDLRSKSLLLFDVSSSVIVATTNQKVKIYTSNCPADHELIWYNNNDLIHTGSPESYREIIITGNSKIKVLCSNKNISNCYNSDSVFISTGPCNSLEKPIIKFSPTQIKEGEGFQVYVEKCNGSISWYLNNTLIQNESRSSFNTKNLGIYKVKCKQIDCDTLVSDPASPNASKLWIKHDIENNEIISGQSFKLEAEGCSNGYISWKLPDGTLKPLQNPLTANAPGTYIAYCINSLTQVTISQATQTFTLKTANKPVLIKSIEGCIYDNEKVTIQAYCSSGMTLKWSDQTTANSFPTYKQVGPGTYSAQCCNGGNCSASESVSICMSTPENVTISSNKEDSTHTTYLYPTEAAILTAEGCNYGAILWDSKGVQLWGRSITAYGPGVYKARCYVSDRSMGNQTLYEIQAKEPGGVSITSSSQYAYSNQVVTLFGSGCANGVIHWQFPVNGKDSVVKGQSIDVIGPGTYKGWCVSFGKSSTPSTITILPAGGVPYVKVSKTLVRPNETYTFVVDYSACYNLQWWGGRTLITQNGVTREEWGVFPTSITGPAKIEAQCGDRWWDKQVREVFLAPADNMRLVANKTKAKTKLEPPVPNVPPGEKVTLTTYGCDFGYVEWQIGTTKILGNDSLPMRQIYQYGPGLYKARCIGDFTVSSDWVSVIVEGDGSMTPTISGPNRICPNTPATITTAGCPYGYYNVWNTVEKGGWGYDGNSVTIYTPQTVKFRCNKNDDSWASEEKTLIIEPAFPEDVKAKSSGSVVLGSAASFSATDITGATYLWSVPVGAIFTDSNLTSRVLQVASVTEAYAGEYTCKVTFGTCAIDVKTTLDISACENLYIKAYNPITNVESNKLTRKQGFKDKYEPIVLEVQTLDGKVIKTMDYTWDTNPNLVEDPDVTKKYRATTEKMGHYQVIASKNSITCPMSIDIFAQPCTVVGDNFACGTAGGSSIDANQTDLQNLAVGDEFTTSDYTVVVTDMESGSPAAGWKGKGKLIFNFLKLSNNLAIQIPISVKFEGIKINQCYQLYYGTVITEYDPSWGSVRSIKNIQDELDAIRQQLIDLLTVGTEINNSQIQSLSTRLEEIKSNDIINWDNESKTFTSNNISVIQNALTCTVGRNNSRISFGCDSETALALIIGIDLKAYELIANAKGRKDNLPRTPNSKSSGNAYSIAYQDKPGKSDSRFDFFGKSRYSNCIEIGESANFNIFKDYIKKFGLGQMADHLKSGSGLTLDFSNNSEIISEIKSSTAFNEFINQFQNEVKTKINNNAIAQINDSFFNNLKENIPSPNFSILTGLIPAKIFVAMGGTQYYDISLKVYRKKTTPNSTALQNFIFDYDVEFQDTYGADFDDINNTIKGNLSSALNSFFTLQHFYNGYKPYYTKVKLRKSFTYENY